MPMRGAGWIRVTHPCAGRLPKQTPRLACVKPVASVHPEPGSNSSLYNLIFVRFSRKLVVCLMLTGFNRIKAGKYYSYCSIKSLLTVRICSCTLYILQSSFSLPEGSKTEDRCTAMSVWNVFKDRMLPLGDSVDCVPCRKRVQRYSKILNYQTFCKENFKRKLQSVHK